MLGWQWRSSVITGFLAVGTALSVGEAALSRPEPDDTLGDERSQVRDASPVDFEIEGGTTRGNNLFHSFREFNVDEGGSVYFINPDDESR